MIRFVDLTGDYWTHPDESEPICAFLSTSDDRFVLNDDGSHTFSSFEDIHNAQFNDTVRLARLTPCGFFERKNPLTAEEAEVAIDILERIASYCVRRSRTRLLQRAEKWIVQAMNVLRRRYT